MARETEAKEEALKKLDAAAGEIRGCHSQIARQNEVNHAQSQRIDELSHKLQEFTLA